LLSGNTNGKGQADGQKPDIAQSSGGNVQIIQIQQTVVTEANGQQLSTDIIQAIGQQSAAAAPPPQAQAPPAEAKPTSHPIPMAEMPVLVKSSVAVAEAPKPMSEAAPAEAKPTPPPEPMAEVSAQPKNTMEAGEAAKLMPAQMTPSVAQGSNVTVRL
jgi:hypothetical protein